LQQAHRESPLIVQQACQVRATLLVNHLPLWLFDRPLLSAMRCAEIEKR